MSEPPALDATPSLADWYEAPSGDLEQGDVLFNFHVVTPTVGDGGNYAYMEKTASVAVLTQTCDIPKGGQKTIMVAEVHEYDVLAAHPSFTHLGTAEYRQGLARGTAIAEFLLPPSPDGKLPWSLVSFRDTYVVPKQFGLQKFTDGESLRLASPYKEYFSQSLARFFMRVGLPATLREFEQYKPSKAS